MLDTFDPALIGATLLVVFCAATLRGLTGFGFALAAVPLLGFVMEPVRAVPLAMAVAAFGGLAGLHGATRACDWPSLRWLALAAAIGTPLGALVLKSISADLARLAIAAFTLSAVVGIVRRAGAATAAAQGRARDLVFGFLAGLFNGLAAMPGPPIVAYYMSAPLGHAQIRASLLVFFQFTGFFGVAGAIALGLLDRPTGVLVALSVPAFWLGNGLGARLFALGSEASYRALALGCLILTALASAVPAVAGLWRGAGAAGWLAR